MPRDECQSVRFGPFELDRQSGELRRDGERVHVQEKPVRILEALTEQPGVLVTRDQLRHRLWSADTFVDFENGLNNAINRLRAALGDKASKPRFVETVGSRGYRFVAAVRTEPTARDGSAMRLVVLPFRALRDDPETAFLAVSLPDAIAAALSGLESLLVRSSLAAAKLGCGADDLEAIARDLDVNLLLSGTILRDEDQLRVSTQLVELPRGTLRWAHTTDATLDQLFRVQDILVCRIVESLSLPLSVTEQRTIAGERLSSGRAYASYLRANHMSENPATVARARDLYLEVLNADPAYAPAWARLARAYRFMAKFEVDTTSDCLRLAEESAGRALALNPELSLAHLVHAQLELESGRVRAAIVRLLDRVRLHRRDPHLFAALVQALRYGGLLEASIAADRCARDLDPALRTSVAYTHWMAGDVDRAVEEGRRIGEMGLGMFLVAGERLQEARDWLTDARRRFAGQVPLDYVRSLSAFVDGDRNASTAAADSVYRRPAFSDGEGLYCIAIVMMWNGEHDSAMEVLASAVSRGFACLPALDLDSVWTPVRGLPAFVALHDQAEQGHFEIKAEFERMGGLHLLVSHAARG